MNVEIAQYAAQVGAALSDLPEQARDDLLEDLPAHLAEVAAEIEAEGGGATLTERLGPPSAYAAELRATLGHTGGPSRTAAWAGRAVSRARTRWSVLDRRPRRPRRRRRPPPRDVVGRSRGAGSPLRPLNGRPGAA
ncbi:HAAS signaling domain-containing protein [Catellatospora methionotrophica]|uniref:HAAS signaling domain-containing protein n=1 Tax=Catellatospora methionotrophica TaxID=121620 RepID=UPI0033F3E64A